MKTETGRRVLFLLWITGFVANLCIVLYFFKVHYIHKDEVFDAIKSLNSIYAPYLGAIAVFYFAKKRRAVVKLTSVMPFVIAISVTLIWNLLVTYFLGWLTINDAIEFCNSMEQFSWLLAAAFGFYFAAD